jgi:hypothetical protein
MDNDILNHQIEGSKRLPTFSLIEEIMRHCPTGAILILF